MIFSSNFFFALSPPFLPGLEEFENKIDKLAGDENGNSIDNDNWMARLYHKFKDTLGSDDNSIEMDAAGAEMDGMEPPILDATWGLADVRQLYDSKSSFIHLILEIIQFIKLLFRRLDYVRRQLYYRARQPLCVEACPRPYGRRLVHAG